MADRILAGQVALVTGASGGLGAHFASVLAEAGAAVALAARRVDRVQAGAGAIQAAGGRATGIALDVTDADAIAPAFSAVEQTLGPISIVINNAGMDAPGRAVDVAARDWDQTFAVNVRGTFLVAQEAARRMIKGGVAGRIVNIASIAAEMALPGLAAYCASKAAVAMLTKSLAREWARHGIAVNALSPGYIATEINADWFAGEAGQRQVQGFPRRRLMGASDLDAALLMLAGPAAGAITGTIVTVDDGQSLAGA